MLDSLKTLIKQPYWVITLFLSVLFILISCMDVSMTFPWKPHKVILPLIIVGGVLLFASLTGYAANFWLTKTKSTGDTDVSLVREKDGVLSVTVEGCEVRVLEGRLEEYVRPLGVAVVLPCNEYFDDRCANDARSALGAFVGRLFDGQTDEFVSFMRNEAKKIFGSGTIQQKTSLEQAESFGSGKCLLLRKPLGRPDTLALISTTTQRAGQGLAAQISCLFEGMHELNQRLADERIDEAVMPVLGGGHGGIHPPLAFTGLLLAIAEAARYGQGSQRMRKVTIVVFKRDLHTSAEVDRQLVRRALALIASQNEVC